MGCAGGNPIGLQARHFGSERRPENESDNPFEERRYECVQRSRDLIDKVSTFILATDDDEPGRVLAADLARLLGPERCKFILYPDGCKDLNDVLVMHDRKPLSPA
jgi:twinkle protein